MISSNSKKFGLIGRNIDYSFSRKFFTEKFEKEGLNDCSYQNFDLSHLSEFPSVIENIKNLKGMNVTIPYKQEIFTYLDEIDEIAQEIGAVNTIKITKTHQLKGFNTDFYGFKKSLKPFLKSHHQKALILGTGGASKAVAYALKDLKIPYKYVSRNPDADQLSYNDIDNNIFNEYQIIINCTPIGTFPNVNQYPPLPYFLFTEKHLAYDLIYNPEETSFLRKAKEHNATTVNGLQMLIFQAEKAWEIWNE